MSTPPYEEPTDCKYFSDFDCIVELGCCVAGGRDIHACVCLVSSDFSITSSLIRTVYGHIKKKEVSSRGRRAVLSAKGENSIWGVHFLLFFILGTRNL